MTEDRVESSKRDAMTRGAAFNKAASF
jgi:hypothetical protein